MIIRLFTFKSTVPLADVPGWGHYGQEMRVAAGSTMSPAHPSGCEASIFDVAADLPARSARMVSSPGFPPRILLTRPTISPPGAFPHRRSFEASAQIVHQFASSACERVVTACLLSKLNEPFKSAQPEFFLWRAMTHFLQVTRRHFLQV